MKYFRFICSSNDLETFIDSSWTKRTIFDIYSLFSSFSSSSNFKVTCSIASPGQLSNQSIVQQSTNAGNFLQRTLRASPMGLIHKIMWRLFLTLSTNFFQTSPSVNSTGTPFYSKYSFNSFNNVASSSIGNIFGTSPEFRRLFISSRIPSSLITLSVIKKDIGFPWRPANGPPQARRTDFLSHSLNLSIEEVLLPPFN